MIAVNNLTKNYRAERVLNNITLQLSGNQIHFIMGKNGSGKTTLIKCLLGLETYKGDISFSGKSFQDVRGDVFVIFDDIPLYDNLSGFQNIQLMLEERMPFEKGKVVDLHLLTNRKLKERVKGYSMGERKKLALIAAILLKPPYLIVDEISNGLDIETLEILREKLTELKQDSLIIATGHHFEFYENITDRLLVLRDGIILSVDEYKKGKDNFHEIYRRYISHN